MKRLEHLFRIRLERTNTEKLLRICGSTPVTAMRLFEPYWRTVAVVIVKDLQSRPQIVQRVCDLLNMTVSQFLQITQFYTIPYLIATKRKDLLQRIVTACGPEHSIKSLCMGHAQLAAILSFLLLQPSTDQETMIMSLLKEASPDFKDADIIELMKSEPMLTAFELLKVAGEEEEGRSARVSPLYFYHITPSQVSTRFIKLSTLLQITASDGMDQARVLLGEVVG